MNHPLTPARPSATAPKTADDGRVVMHRMSPEVYAFYETQLRHTPQCDTDTTAIQAGFKLGVEHALRVLRSGFVIEDR